MNAISPTNQRLITVLLVLLSLFVFLLVIGILSGFLMMGGGMLGINGLMLNNVMSACAEMMQNFQTR